MLYFFSVKFTYIFHISLNWFKCFLYKRRADCNINYIQMPIPSVQTQQPKVIIDNKSSKLNVCVILYVGLHFIFHSPFDNCLVYSNYLLCIVNRHKVHAVALAGAHNNSSGGLENKSKIVRTKCERHSKVSLKSGFNNISMCTQKIYAK